MGTTAKGLPYMENTDPLANVAASQQALATAVDGMIPGKVRMGGSVLSTDASGDLLITHGLGDTPDVALAVLGNLAARFVVCHTFTTTTFKARVYNSSTGAALTSTAGVVVYWIAQT